MDIETHPSHLKAELAELRHELKTITPAVIIKFAESLHGVRNNRAKVAERLMAACAYQHYHSPEKSPSAEMQTLEAEVAKFDKQIGEHRAKLTAARIEWKPKLLKTLKRHTSAADAALAHAANLIEAASELYGEADKFTALHGFGDGNPKSGRLREITQTLRSFCSKGPSTK